MFRPKINANACVYATILGIMTLHCCNRVTVIIYACHMTHIDPVMIAYFQTVIQQFSVTNVTCADLKHDITASSMQKQNTHLITSIKLFIVCQNFAVSN